MTKFLKIQIIKITVTKENKLILFKDVPKIYLEKDGKYWYYSKETVAAIKDLYSEVYPFGISQWADNLPESFKILIFGVALWQYLGILLFLTAGYFFIQIVFYSL